MHFDSNLLARSSPAGKIRALHAAPPASIHHLLRDRPLTTLRIPHRHTSAADDDERFTESQYHVYEKPSVETDGCQGYILMSSNIVFYD